MSSFLGVPVDAAYHLVSGLTVILTPVLGGLAAVAAIVVFTMAVRLLLMPLSLRALRGQAVQARLAPQLVAPDVDQAPKIVVLSWEVVSQAGETTGSGGRIRTYDQSVNSRLLYR